MNREDIIRMAQEAGLHRQQHNLMSNPVQPRFSYDGYEENLERFAALVAKHTLANIDPSSFMTWQEGYEAGKQTEREACANTAGLALLGADKALSDRVLKAIRARGQA